MGDRASKDALFEAIALMGKAFASPVRLELLDLLAQAPRSVEELARASGQSTANASQHLQALRAAGIGVQVHYIPVHLQPWYRRALGTAPGDCPRAEQFYREVLSLPCFPSMTDDDVVRVVATLAAVVAPTREESEHAHPAW